MVVVHMVCYFTLEYPIFSLPQCSSILQASAVTYLLASLSSIDICICDNFIIDGTVVVVSPITLFAAFSLSPLLTLTNEWFKSARVLWFLPLQRHDIMVMSNDHR